MIWIRVGDDDGSNGIIPYSIFLSPGVPQQDSVLYATFKGRRFPFSFLNERILLVIPSLVELIPHFFEPKIFFRVQGNVALTIRSGESDGLKAFHV